MRLRHIPGCEEFIASSEDCISGERVSTYKGRWDELFGKKAKLYIEIGMGKGQFIRGMADRDREIHFIGIERYESVLMKALQRKHQFEEENGKYNNLFFMCVDAKKLGECFTRGEVDKIFLNFSDPWPKARYAKRRLTSPDFMAVYDQILKEDGVVEFKTDNVDLFAYSLEAIPEAGWEIIYQTTDFHAQPECVDNILTEYEEKFSKRGQKICKLIARRKK